MSDRPTTGEWTADEDGVLLPMHRFIGQYAKEIANAHNAALAAERNHVAALQRLESTLQEQLAAEREKNDDWRNTERRVARERDEARQQLAAEREQYMDERNEREGLDKLYAAAMQQLAAEREKLAAAQAAIDSVCVSSLEQGPEAICECLDKLEDAIKGGTAALDAAKQQAVNEFTRNHHNPIVTQLNKQLTAEREKLRESDAAVCSLLALAAVVKGKPETPQSLKNLASKELLNHNRGAYLIQELRQLREQLAAEREKYATLTGSSDEVIEIDEEGKVHRPPTEAQQLRSQLAAEREQLSEMEKDRDRWRDMAHGGPTKRPQWR